MALLGEDDRAICYGLSIAEIMRKAEEIGIVKTDLRAAVNDADQWASDNAASYNAALPLPARTSLTTSQKAFILVKVLERRYLVAA